MLSCNPYNAPPAAVILPSLLILPVAYATAIICGLYPLTTRFKPDTLQWTDWSVRELPIHGIREMANHNGSCSEDPGKRLAILEQAIRTFAELGFRGTDVQAIADRAGVGKGTVYRYFRSKEDLFWATTMEVFFRLEKSINESQEGVEGACEKIRASAIAYAEFFERNPQCLEVFIQERAEFRGDAPESHREYHQQLMKKFERIIEQGIECGELRPVDAYKTVHAIGSLLYGTVVLGCHLTTLPPIEMAKYNIDVLLRGIRFDISLESDSSLTQESREQ